MSEFPDPEKTVAVSERAIRLLSEVFGPDLAGLFKDRIYYIRAIVAIRLLDKLQRVVEERRLHNPKAIPLRIAIPFLSAALIEDDDSIQDRWAELLANAMDPTFTAEIHKQTGEILRNLSPIDCLVLDTACQRVNQLGRNQFSPEEIVVAVRRDPISVRASFQRIKSFGLFEEEQEILFDTPPLEQNLWTNRNLHHITDWGRLFIEACTRPRSPFDI